MSQTPRRFYVVSPDLATAAGFDAREAAEAAALAFGDGAHVVDTVSRPYQPAASRVENGEVRFVGFGSFDARLGLDACLIEAARKGYAPLVSAYLAKGANADAVDAGGSPAIVWAVAGGSPEVVRLLIGAGADPGRADGDGMTALRLAQQRRRSDLAAIVRAAGAR